MIRKLRFKFIAANMALITIVLLLVFVGFAFNYSQQQTHEVYVSMEQKLQKAIEEDEARQLSESQNKNTDKSEKTSDENNKSNQEKPKGDSAEKDALKDEYIIQDQSYPNNVDIDDDYDDDEYDGDDNESESPYETDDDDEYDQVRYYVPDKEQETNTAVMFSANYLIPSILHPEPCYAEDEIASAPSARYPLPEIGGTLDPEDIHTMILRLEPHKTPAVIGKYSNASISNKNLQEALQFIEAHPHESKGHIEGTDLLYLKQTVGDATYVALTDKVAATGWTSSIPILALGVLLALIIFLVINIFLSRWVLSPIEKTWNSQRQFIADASHELKTPIASIMANASVIQEHPHEEISTQMQWINNTQMEAQKMRDLVNEMLLLARLDNKQSMRKTASILNNEKKSLNFSDLAETTLLEYETLAYERGIAFESFIEPQVFVMGDTSDLQRLLGTLIDNACKYAGNNGYVTVSLNTERKNAVLSVHNTGLPISQEDLPHVFDRFWRADKARTQQGGHGLGLAIAKQIVDYHYGTISVTSSAANGTTFMIKIPLIKKRVTAQ